MRMKTAEERTQAALEYLLELIERGWEYPDAHVKASVRFGVHPDNLRDAYDEHTSHY